MMLLLKTIAKVDINTKAIVKHKSSDYEEIKQFLAQSWLIDEELIQIAGERGDLTH